MIIRGDIFNPPVPVEAVVNPVNCVGVMGAGLALQFKKRYPEMFTDYKAAALRGFIQLGLVNCWACPSNSKFKYILNFPTKQHWKDPSRLAAVKDGLSDLVMWVQILDIKSIAIPALGCGLGGLDWHDVKPLIEEAARQMPETLVLIYGPQ